MMYKINDKISVRDDVTMITIDNVNGDHGVMGGVLQSILRMNLDADILDYHNSFKGSKLTILVENSGILRVVGAVGMFKDRISNIICDVYCSNTAVTVAPMSNPMADAAAVIGIMDSGGVEIYHLFSCSGGITVVINEAYTDRVCDILTENI